MPIHPAHMVPDGSIPKTYIHQEYPKWVNGVIVNNEAEEQDLLQALEGSDENPETDKNAGKTDESDSPKARRRR